MSSKKKVRMNEDRISSLPDGVLCHMLSFLPTKYSVRTRILSIRWNNLFTFVPILDFDYSSHDSNLDSPANSATSFIQFVNSVFISYNVSRMNKFRLHFNNFEQPVERYPVLSWISSAIHRQVQYINISLSFGGPWTLPRDLFSCKSLTYLRIWRHFNIVLPQSVCLPCLKTCDFGLASFNNDAARRLFRSCPALEKLSLTSCYFGEGVEVLNISSNTLKSFNIHVCEDHFQFVLNVPNLVYFDYVVEGPGANEFSGLDTMKSLLEASIYYEQESEMEDSVSVELVRGFCHVRQLCIYCGPMEAFLRSGHSLPTFKNLTRLIYGPMSNLSSELLSDLLDNSPRLEFISFNQRYGDDLDGADQNNYVLPEHVPMCVSLQLKEVEFRCFSMLDYECKLIKYFLKYAKNLKKMHIRTKLTWDEQFEISSTLCEVVFDPDGIED